MNFFRRSNTIETYKRVRAAGHSLFPKINETSQSREFDMLKAAKKMTLPIQRQTIIFDGETETAALMDFFFHEFRKGGRRLIDCCQPVALTPDEQDVLAAHRLAQTSLFEILARDAKRAEVRLGNLLFPEQPEVILSDVSMSQTGWNLAMPLLFLRVVACQGIAMSSGSNFTFQPDQRNRLLEGYARRMETVAASEQSERRFIFFYQQHREFGVKQEFANPF